MPRHHPSARKRRLRKRGIASGESDAATPVRGHFATTTKRAYPSCGDECFHYP